MTDIVIYGFDVGVGNNRAWTRLDSCPEWLEQFTLEPGHKFSLQQKSYKVKKSLEELSKLLLQDIGKRKVAIGFEAPMWIPTYTFDKELSSVFTERFAEEGENLRWYSRGGAVASQIAMPSGIELLTILKKKFQSNISVTTDISNWNKDTLYLYEAFIAGKHKFRPSNGNKNHQHYWDSFLSAAVLYDYLFLGPVPSNIRNSKAQKCQPTAIMNSLSKRCYWNEIADAVHLDVVSSTDMCDVYTFG
ncbi:hypothetical protein NKT34_06390 [Paenibacillus polysaccharolyticus]|uniref:hypothetical protein n=1 Tax=Paenibacillus polysaccharolyticus TaxID=582692 RepID=UPI00209D2EFF|nr:hypothetical protein [Paenibacillus polysaccharolyticus]MCP1132909.1 hypothetical protein [Paenibacillus polysaccharolyticus]